ncbi:S8 family peptidase [Paenibacillus sp. NFR01]|uniref:S8 family peptidase n=1 Tax=Paenibacillus sp. NFR01 TaxID=1566279 RepID=UPI0008BC01AC|nr:S8 family peptidase [Paenibacillus sp. NFR01]SES95440.1 serine protease AprX [Paenibacillus sp. NFR01]
MSETHWLHRYAASLNSPLKRKLLQTPAAPRGKRARLPVIIQFKDKLTEEQIKGLRRHVGAHPLKIGHRLHSLRAVSARVSPECLKQICCWPGLRCVHLDERKKATLHIAAPAIGAAAVRKSLGLTGKGVRIAILDTGVYPHHDLTRPANRIAGFKDLVNGRQRPYDDNGHGTHVAGDAAGNGHDSRGKYTGPAPEAEIVGVKVLDRDGFGYDSTIIKGIEWCIANRKRLRLRILSLSLGGAALQPPQDDLLCQAIERAVRCGLTVVVSAGNSGPGRGTVESPGISPSAITVGAVDDRRTVRQRDDRITSYSSRGPARGGGTKPDLVAPGESIISLRAPGSELARQYPYMTIDKSYFVMSGTSMSAPLVAGAAALLLQRSPALTPRQVKAALMKNAFSLGLKANTAGRGEADLRYLLQQGPNPPPRFCDGRAKRRRRD